VWLIALLSLIGIVLFFAIPGQRGGANCGHCMIVLFMILCPWALYIYGVLLPKAPPIQIKHIEAPVPDPIECEEKLSEVFGDPVEGVYE
jgi:hypothetical protein